PGSSAKVARPSCCSRVGPSPHRKRWRSGWCSALPRRDARSTKPRRWRAIDEAEALAREILSRAPIAVAMTWEALHRGASLGADESARLGADYFGLVAATEDFREGTRAFIEKTTPVFSGTQTAPSARSDSRCPRAPCLGTPSTTTPYTW